jgi:hypothetical protein
MVAGVGLLVLAILQTFLAFIPLTFQLWTLRKERKKKQVRVCADRIQEERLAMEATFIPFLLVIQALAMVVPNFLYYKRLWRLTHNFVHM